jgi:Flp pilus assembly protein TadD|eukprot:COSAG06_NODE_764_length_12486_cov_190.016630_14_plen_136_part_00
MLAKGTLLLADSRLAEAGVCFAKCAKDDECQLQQAVVLLRQHRYEAANAAIRRMRSPRPHGEHTARGDDEDRRQSNRHRRTAGASTDARILHVHALALVRLGDIQGAVSVISQLGNRDTMTTPTPIACTGTKPRL